MTPGVDDPRQLARKAALAELLLHAARRLGETLEPERVYDTFHDLLAGVIEHDGVVVSSYDERDDSIRCEYAWVEGNRLDPSTFPQLTLNRSGGGMQSRVIVNGEPLLVNDVAEQVRQPGTYYDVDKQGEMRKLPDTRPPGTKAAMMVPVKESGRVVGVVQLMSDSAFYTDEDLEVFDGLVGQMAAAVRNVRLQKERLRLEAAEAAARAIAAERETAVQVLEAVGDGIFLLREDGVVLLWNSAAELVTNVRAERVRGRPIASVFPSWEALATKIPIAEAGEAPRSVTLPMEVVGGTDLWLSFSAVQSAAGTVYAFRDLTSERRLEEEKSDFIATVSHELRTPMAAVYGAAQTLLQRKDTLEPEKAHELLEMIVAQSARLSHITEEVLLAGRLDRGEVRVQREPVDLADVARRTVEAMRSQLPDSAAIEVEIEPEVGPAAGDPDRIQQVLVNLIDNAVKYGGGDVRVRVAPADGRIRLTVTDSGPGIPLADQERIFEKFYRADPQLTTAPHGTGLGLYISRELVRRMAGRIEVASEPARGATFSVDLPLA